MATTKKKQAKKNTAARKGRTAQTENEQQSGVVMSSRNIGEAFPGYDQVCSGYLASHKGQTLDNTTMLQGYIWANQAAKQTRTRSQQGAIGGDNEGADQAAPPKTKTAGQGD